MYECAQMKSHLKADEFEKLSQQLEILRAQISMAEKDLSVDFLKRELGELLETQDQFIKTSEFDAVSATAFGIVSDTQKSSRLTLHTEKLTEPLSPELKGLTWQLVAKVLKRHIEMQTTGNTSPAQLA